MPYVKQFHRPDIHPHSERVATCSGDLNYQISVLMNDYIVAHGLSYDVAKDCSSACEEAASEFRRRVLAPYEDLKILENGDVYEGALALMPEPPF